MNDVSKWPKDKKMRLFNLLDIKEAKEIDNIKVDTEFINKVDMVLNGESSSVSVSHSDVIEFKDLKPREQELLNDIIFLIKETSVFSVLALPDLMYVAKDLIGIYYKTDEALFMLVMAYLVLLLPISLICSWIERRVRYAGYGN